MLPVGRFPGFGRTLPHWQVTTRVVENCMGGCLGAGFGFEFETLTLKLNTVKWNTVKLRVNDGRVGGF